MPQGSGRFLRDNIFLVAAASLPLLVAGLFMAASVVPRWLVPPPAYDLLLRGAGAYDPAAAQIAVDYAVRDGRVEATVRRAPEKTYVRPGELFLFEHETMTVREVPVDLPADVGETDPPRTFVVEALAGRRVVAQPRAPDGYEFQTRPRRGPGIVGDVFGMNRYDAGLALVNGGRVVTITLPLPYSYYTVSAVGWVVDAGDEAGTGGR